MGGCLLCISITIQYVNMHIQRCTLRDQLEIVNISLVPRATITANAVEGQVKLRHRMTSSGRLEAWHFR